MSNRDLPKPVLLAFLFEIHCIRVHFDGGEPWFCAKEVARALHIANSRDAVCQLADADHRIVLAPSRGGPQRTSLVSHRGLRIMAASVTDAYPGFPVPGRLLEWVEKEVMGVVRPRRSRRRPAVPRPVMRQAA